MKALKKTTIYDTIYELYKVRVGLAVEKAESVMELLKDLDKVKKDDVTLSHASVLGKTLGSLDNAWNSLCEI